MITAGHECVAGNSTAPPEFVSALESVLVRDCRNALGDGLRAVLLTGSLARGEATGENRSGQWILRSDAEAVVVLQDSCSLPTREVAAELRRRVECDCCAAGVRVKVSLSLVHSDYLRKLPPHIFSYELRSFGKLLVGEPEILELIPRWSPEELSREDAWRMLSNRLIEQMGSEDEERQYRSMKLCLDLASSLLVFQGRFAAGYQARLKNMERLSTVEGWQLPMTLEKFLPRLRDCMERKLNPSSTAAMEPSAMHEIVAWGWQSWLWELREMTRGDSDAGKMLHTFGKDLGLMALLRGWGYAARRMGWMRSIPSWPRWWRHWIAYRTPRHAIYLAAFRWYQLWTAGKPVTREQVEQLCRMLPSARLSQDMDDAARQIAKNYMEFAVETRS